LGEDSIAAAENGGRVSPAPGNQSNGSSACASGTSTPKSSVTPEEYFTPEVDLHGRDVGGPKNLSTKVQRRTMYTTVMIMEV